MMKLGTIIKKLKKLGTSYPCFSQLYLTFGSSLERRSKKYINHVTHPLVSAVIRIFHRKFATFIISRNTDIDCILIHNFYSFNFLPLNMVAILMMSAKSATLGLLKI